MEQQLDEREEKKKKTIGFNSEPLHWLKRILFYVLLFPWGLVFGLLSTALYIEKDRNIVDKPQAVSGLVTEQKLGARNMNDTILLSEWDSDAFRKKLAYWESVGYEAVLSTFRMDSEVDPGTGRVYRRYSMGLAKRREER